MSVAAPPLPPPLREGDRLTRDEFLRRWDAMPELRWAELIDGIVHMASPVSRTHDGCHLPLGAWLLHYEAATPGVRAGSAGTWLMSGDNVPQPDCTMTVLPEFGGQSSVEGDYSAGAPELIVEVSHTTTARDRGAKLCLYERCRVREYVIVQPGKRRIEWRQSVGGKYRTVLPDADGWFRSRVFPGLWLDPHALWNRDLAALTAAAQQGLATKEHAAFVRQLATQKR